jgi:hypothetical protein
MDACKKPENDGLDNLRRDLTQGLLYTHRRLSANTAKNLETASFLYALVEILNDRGIITVDELDRRKKTVGVRLVEQFRKNGSGVMLQDPEYDKYNFSQAVGFDCGANLSICGAACCRIPFALSKQDIREGIVRWRLAAPYLIEHEPGGYCVHFDRGTGGCAIYRRRPVPCRAFDCRRDPRIWLDFAQQRINPDVRRPDWPGCLAPSAAAPRQDGAPAGDFPTPDPRDQRHDRRP